MNQRKLDETIETSPITIIIENNENLLNIQNKTQINDFNENKNNDVKTTILPKNLIQQKKHRLHHSKQFSTDFEKTKNSIQLTSAERKINLIEIEQVLNFILKKRKFIFKLNYFYFKILKIFIYFFKHFFK